MHQLFFLCQAINKPPAIKSAKVDGSGTPRAVLDKFAQIQMLDVHFPTTDGRTLILSRYTQPQADQNILLDRLGLTLPKQPPPRITAAGKLLR